MAPVLQVYHPDLQVAEFSDTVAKCEGLEKEKILQAWHTAAHDTFSYLHPDLQSLTAETRVFLFMRGQRDIYQHSAEASDRV